VSVDEIAFAPGRRGAGGCLWSLGSVPGKSSAPHAEALRTQTSAACSPALWLAPQAPATPACKPCGVGPGLAPKTAGPMTRLSPPTTRRRDPEPKPPALERMNLAFGALRPMTNPSGARPVRCCESVPQRWNQAFAICHDGRTGYCYSRPHDPPAHARGQQAWTTGAGVVRVFPQIAEDEHATNRQIGLVFVANKRSDRVAMRQAVRNAGAQLLHLSGGATQENVEELAATFERNTLILRAMSRGMTRLRACFESEGIWRLHLLLHSVAFGAQGRLGGEFLHTSREAFRIAHDVSAYSLSRTGARRGAVDD